jgi:hypothetical protein
MCLLTESKQDAFTETWGVNEMLLLEIFPSEIYLTLF